MLEITKPSLFFQKLQRREQYTVVSVVTYMTISDVHDKWLRKKCDHI